MSLPAAGAGSMSDAGTILRFRHSASGAVAGAVLAGVVPGAVVAWDAAWYPSLVVLLPACGVPILTAAWSWRSRTDVTAYGLVIRGLLSVRRVPWVDVSDLVQASNGRIWARLTSGRVVTSPVVRSDDVRLIRAVAAGSVPAARPTVVTRGGWGFALIAFACYIALGLAIWSVAVQRPVSRHLVLGETVMVQAGGWPFAFLYDCVSCSGVYGELDPSWDVFWPGWFLLDAAIVGALPALALGTIGYRRRWFVVPRRPHLRADARRVQSSSP